VAACGSSTSPTCPLLLRNLLPSTPVSPHPPLRTNGVPIELDRPSPSFPGDMPPPLTLYPLVVPSAIEPPLSGLLMGVFQSLVWAAHADPRAPGVFFGLAAIGAAAKVTPHRRRFCPSAFFGYFLEISRRHRHVVGRHEVSEGATSQRRRAHQKSALPYIYADALRLCLLAWRSVV